MTLFTQITSETESIVYKGARYKIIRKVADDWYKAVRPKGKKEYNVFVTNEGYLKGVA